MSYKYSALSIAQAPFELFNAALIYLTFRNDNFQIYTQMWEYYFWENFFPFYFQAQQTER